MGEVFGTYKADLAVSGGWGVCRRGWGVCRQQNRRVVAEFVAEHLGAADDPLATMVLDESGQEKKGELTCGVKRQYVGCAGRVSNAVNVVYATLATCRGHALVAARLYLPREWVEDRRLRGVAATPEHVVFKTKTQLATDILTGMHDAGLLPPWVTGDAVYGKDAGLRGFCERHEVGYVFGLPCSFAVTLTSRRRVRADQALKLVPLNGGTGHPAVPGPKGTGPTGGRGSPRQCPSSSAGTP